MDARDRTLPWRLVALTILRLLVAPARALAAEEVERSATSAAANGVHYEAPRECPDVNAYLTQVEQRLGSNWQPALEQFAQRLNISITRVGERYLGTLDFVNDRGEHYGRTVSGTVCAEIVEGLGLMTALAVQARVNGSEAAPNEPESSAGTRTNAPITEASAAPTPVVRHETTARATTAPSSVHVRFGGRASASSAVGPEVAFGGGAFATLELGRARVGLGADAFYSRDVQAWLTRADFRLLSARFEGCPWSLQLGSRVTLEPCAAGELGSFWVGPHVNPPTVTLSQPKAVTWGALDALGRLVLRLPPFVAAVELIGRVPLRRERFYVQSRDQIVFQIPAASAGASVGLGLRF